MLKRLSSREILAHLAVEWEATLAAAWLGSIRSITSSVGLKDVVAELERGNLDAALRLLNIDADRFARFEGAILQAYNAGGQAVVSGIPRLRDPDGNRVHFAWGVRNTPAEDVLRRHATALVDDLVGEQLASAQSILVDGLARGQNPRQTALRLVGPINIRTKLREGGVLGLSAPFVERVDVLRTALATRDVAKLREIIGVMADGTFDPTKGWKLRDRRFDRAVAKAIREGHAIPADRIEAAVRQYANRALKYRGDVLAQAETNTALATAKNDAFQQQIDAGKLAAADLTKTWVRTVSRVPRQDHLELVGQVVAFDQPFIASDGTLIMYPHAPGLPARHRVGCKCGCTETIDFTAQALRRYQARVG